MTTTYVATKELNNMVKAAVLHFLVFAAVGGGYPRAPLQQLLGAVVPFEHTLLGPVSLTIGHTAHILSLCIPNEMLRRVLQYPQSEA